MADLKGAAVPGDALSLPRGLEQALEAHRSGRLAEAEALYRGILEARPDDPEVLHLLGVVAAQQGRHEAAAVLIARAIEGNPRNPRFYGNLGNALAELGRFARAVDSYDRSLALDGRYAGAHFNRGCVLRELGRLEEAARSFRWALALEPENAQASINLGQVCLSLGAPSEALAAFEGAAAPNDQTTADVAEAHLGRGRALDALGRPDDAMAAFERALTLVPELAEAHHELGDLLQSQGRLGEAIERYRQALALKPDFAEAHLGLSCVFGRLGRVEDAKSATRLAIRHRPLRTRLSRGTEDGRLLVLQSMENEAFAGVGKRIKSTNTSTVIGQFDRDRFTVHTVYVDEMFLEQVVPRLPEFDLVFNAITEPDNCPQSLDIAQRFVDGLTVPVINRPEHVQRTTRDENYRRLRHIPGLVFPKTVKVRFGTSPMEAFTTLIEAEAFDYPVIVRRAASHGGKTMVRIDSPSDFQGQGGRFAEQTCYVIEFLDYDFSEGLYDKLRAFVVDGHVVPNHMFRGNAWNMHEGVFMDWLNDNAHPEHVDSYRRSASAFLENAEKFLGAHAFEAFRTVARVLDLEFFGVDFTILGNGHVHIFEANPAMAFGRVPEAKAISSRDKMSEAGLRRNNIVAQIRENNHRVAQFLNGLILSRIDESTAS